MGSVGGRQYIICQPDKSNVAPGWLYYGCICMWLEVHRAQIWAGQPLRDIIFKCMPYWDNSHIMYLINGFLVHLQSCWTVTTINFKTFLSLQKEIPYPLAVTFLHCFPFLPPIQPLHNHYSTFSLCRLSYYWHFVEMGLFNMWSFMAGLL